MPFSPVAARIVINAFDEVMNLRRRQGRVGTTLDEDYAKLDDDLETSLPSLDHDIANTSPHGSAWLLECRHKHGFHYHTFDDLDPMLSSRRVIFFSDAGFTLEFFAYDAKRCIPTGPLERFVVEGSSFTELAFDGRIVHRFRPTSGRLFAISFHARDVEYTDHAAAVQTHSVDIDSFQNTICHTL